MTWIRQRSAVILLAVGLLALEAGLSPRLVGAGPPADEAPFLVRGSEGVRLPAEMPAKLGITTVEARPRAGSRQRLVHLPGSTGLDPTRLIRIRARFAPAEVVQIGQIAEPADGTKPARTVLRDLRAGDRVKKGDLLAVCVSPDVAAKKKDLLDALLQLALDEEILAKAEKSADAVPEVFLLNARRTVSADRSAVNRAVNTLRIWAIPQKEIDAIRQEAKEAEERKNKTETEETRKAREARWARVEVTAPDDGTIVERNVSLHEVIPDNTVDLFIIANLDRLLVVVQIPEEELSALDALKPAQRRWVIRTGTDRDGPGIQGSIAEIGYLIDPKQHTAVLKGHIDNSEHSLRAGQYITASVSLPLAAEVVLPASAIVEEGRKTFVFVQPDLKKPYYEQRRVLIVRRGQDSVHVGSTLTPDQERQGLQIVRPREHVVTSGAVELKALLADLKEAEDR
jgi:RND family efflux transporter MFP subunit